MKFYLSIIATGIVSFMGVLVETAMNITFPTLMNQFKIEPNVVQWLTTGYLVALSILVPMSVVLIKKYKIKSLFISAILFLVLGTLLGSLAVNFEMLIAARAFQGIGTGIALPLMYHIILTQSPKSKLSIMMGLGGMATSIAPAFGPAYGGFMLQTFGWRYIFVGLLPIICFSLIIGICSIESHGIEKSSDIKIPLNTLAYLIVAVISLFLFLSHFKLVFLVISIIAWILFGITNKAHKLIELIILKQRKYALLLISLLTYQMLLLSVAFIIPNFIQIKMGINPMQAGMFMIPGAFVGAILAPISGNLLNKFKEQYVICLGTALTIIPLTIMICYIDILSYNIFLLLHISMMVGVGVTYTNLMTLSLSKLHVNNLSDGSAINNTLQQITGAFGTVISAQILTFFLSRNEQIGIVTGSQVSLVLICVLLFISLFGSFSALKK
ncbi:MFS transporter [Leuconostoc pseudomesenteroides]|uniref:MFS transporter n=1 Tax=Leuconostoc pseudomesenteroides TaxID=33968 RepID=UPI00345EEBF0